MCNLPSKRIKDLTNLKFDNNTIVLEFVKYNKEVYWKLNCGICKEDYIDTSKRISHPTYIKTCIKCNDKKWTLVYPGMEFGIGCKIIRQVENKKQRWLYLCICGKEYEISQSHILYSKVQCCWNCAHIKRGLKITGKNHPGYRHDLTDEDRKQLRLRNDYNWRQNVLKRDKFTCQVSDTNNDLEVHHIYNYVEYPELRHNINNGITLHKDVHKLFHKKYGKKHNNFRQLIEFLDEN